MRRQVAVAVRPYGERLRPRVFALLERLRIGVEVPAELGEDPSNEAVVDFLRERPADYLLIPFHVVRTAHGSRTTGLELLDTLCREVPWVRQAPVIMPVSIFAGAAFEKAWREARRAGVLPIREDDLDKPSTWRALSDFLADFRGGVASVS